MDVIIPLASSSIRCEEKYNIANTKVSDSLVKRNSDERWFYG
jgi:hypothetical protein